MVLHLTVFFEIKTAAHAKPLDTGTALRNLEHPVGLIAGTHRVPEIGSLG